MKKSSFSLWFRWSFLVGILVLPFILSRCGTNSSTPASGTFGSVYVALTTSNCTICHVPTGSATKQYGTQLDLSTKATAYTTLLTKTVTGAQSKTKCGNVKLVSQGNAKNSYLAAVLFNDYGSVNNFAGVPNCAPITTHFNYQNMSPDEKSSILQ